MFKSARKTSSWMILSILMMIPLVNFGFLIWIAFSQTVDPVFRAWARTVILLLVLGGVVSFLQILFDFWSLVNEIIM